MIRPDRRLLITGALAAAAAPGLALAAPAGVTRFAITRNGQPFGHYMVATAVRGNVTAVVSDVAMSARVAGVTVFNYRHHCEEIWRNGQFMEMRSHSVRDNQSDLEDIVTAARVTNGIRITNKAGLSVLPSGAHPFTHWNPETLKGPLFNPQDGALLRVTTAPVGKDAVTLANGSQVMGNHWTVRGETEIEEWYDDTGAWLGLRGKLPDRSTLEYRRV